MASNGHASSNRNRIASDPRDRGARRVPFRRGLLKGGRHARPESDRRETLLKKQAERVVQERASYEDREKCPSPREVEQPAGREQRELPNAKRVRDRTRNGHEQRTERHEQGAREQAAGVSGFLGHGKGPLITERSPRCQRTRARRHGSSMPRDDRAWNDLRDVVGRLAGGSRDRDRYPESFVPGRPSARAISTRWISLVPSPISISLASR